MLLIRNYHHDVIGYVPAETFEGASGLCMRRRTKPRPRPCGSCYNMRS